MVSVEHIVLKRCHFDRGSASGFNYGRDDALLVGVVAIAARGLCLLSLDSISWEMLDLVAATWWNHSVETLLIRCHQNQQSQTVQGLL